MTNLDLSETSALENGLAEMSVAGTSVAEMSVAETSVHHVCVCTLKVDKGYQDVFISFH